MYLEIAIDQGIRLLSLATQFYLFHTVKSLDLLKTAVTLEGGSVNATEVSIAGQSVIDAQWRVGPAINVAWVTSTAVHYPMDSAMEMMTPLEISVVRLEKSSFAGWLCTRQQTYLK